MNSTAFFGNSLYFFLWKKSSKKSQLQKPHPAFGHLLLLMEKGSGKKLFPIVQRKHSISSNTTEIL